MYKIIILSVLLYCVLGGQMLRTNTQQLKATNFTCPAPAYRPTDVFNAMMDQINSCSTGSDMILVLNQTVPQDTHVFSAAQIIEVFDAVTFTDYKCQALQIMNPYIEQLSAVDIVSILDNVVFSDTRLQVLQVIADTLNDTSDTSKNYIVQNGFSFSSDREEAQTILQNAKQRNCIYGTITENVMVFIVDASGSMWYTFKTSDGKTYTRIQYVQQMLTSTIADQLKDYQKFNVIAFGNTVYPWKTDCVNATSDNIQSAITFINSLYSLGGTDISDSIYKAFQSTYDVQAIYFLSDGFPNGGITDKNEMALFLQNQNTNRQQKGFDKIRIDVTSFELGGSESSTDKINARNFMAVIADTTSGKFRDMMDNV